MKKIMTMLLLIGSILITILLTGCSNSSNNSSYPYDKNEVYNVVNAFIKEIKDENYDDARKYYRNGLEADLLSFSSLVNSSYFGHALTEGDISYTIQPYNEETKTTKVTFIYDNEQHSMTVAHIEDDYKIVFNEEEIKR